MQFPKLQLGLLSEYGAFNGNHAYIEGSTAENPQAMIQFFGLPNNRTVEQIAEMPDCADALAFARYAVAAINERGDLRAKAAYPSILLDAAAREVRAYAGYEGNGGEVDDCDYYKRLAGVALEAAGLPEMLAERAALRAKLAALVEAGNRILAYGNVYRYKETEVSPYEQLKAAIEAAEGGAND